MGAPLAEWGGGEGALRACVTSVRTWDSLHPFLLTPTYRCLQQMHQEGLQLEDLFAEPLTSEEQAAVLSAVRKVLPDFQLPTPPPPPTSGCSSPLLTGIYAQVRPCPRDDRVYLRLPVLAPAAQ